LRQKYPSDCIRLSFKSPLDRGVCILLNVMDFCFHVVLHPRILTRAYNCRSFILARHWWEEGRTTSSIHVVISDYGNQLQATFWNVLSHHFHIWNVQSSFYEIYLYQRKFRTVEQITIMVCTHHCAQQLCLCDRYLLLHNDNNNNNNNKN